MPPDYSTVKYWDERFVLQPEPFEWLRQPEELVSLITQVKGILPFNERRILHVGCGTSLLSLKLRTMVNHAEQIHNVDFSTEAIELGKSMELKAELGEQNVTDPADQVPLMRWSRANLLNIQDIWDLTTVVGNKLSYDMIIDKSTSDAIACGSDVELNPMLFDTVAETEDIDANTQSFRVYPVWLLALHLATTMLQGGAWVVFSYSETRFPWYRPDFVLQDVSGTELPRRLSPANFWTLESKRCLIEHEAEIKKQSPAVHHGPVEHWMFVLRRNDNPLGWRKPV